jgi:fructose transport system substrate-binding protein
MTHSRGRVGRRSPCLVAVVGVVVLSLGVTSCGGGGKKQVTAGLITKQETNPFFVTMRQVAEKTASDENVKLLTAAGTSDVDNQSQVAALEDMTKRGAKGILITPADSSAIVPAIEKARQAGVTVIALDTPTNPQSAVDALFATDNRKAGKLIGQYARAKAAGNQITPKIAMLDLAPDITSGQLRHDGFLEGFGIADGDPAIVGSVNTEGDQAKAEAGMGQLLKAHPDINIVYSINEPAAFGAAAAMKAAGKSNDDVILVSVDGGCHAIKDGIRSGEIDATAQQYPENMARKGVQALATAERGGSKPTGYLDTGVELIAGSSVPGVASKDEAFGVRNCWGK